MPQWQSSRASDHVSRINQRGSLNQAVSSVSQDVTPVEVLPTPFMCLDNSARAPLTEGNLDMVAPVCSITANCSRNIAGVCRRRTSRRGGDPNGTAA
jgi:hypothetical protein